MSVVVSVAEVPVLPVYASITDDAMNIYVSPEPLSMDMVVHERVSPVDVSSGATSVQVLESGLSVLPLHVLSMIVHVRVPQLEEPHMSSVLHERVPHVQAYTGSEISHVQVLPVVHEDTGDSPLQLDTSLPERVSPVSPLHEAVSPTPVPVGSVVHVPISPHVLVDMADPVHHSVGGGVISS